MPNQRSAHPVNPDLPGARPERRLDLTLRRHINCLLASGGTLSDRSPLTLAFAGRTLRVRDGRLYNEQGLRDLVVAIASHVWSTPHLRNTAIEICIGQMDQAPDPNEEPSIGRGS